MNRRGIFDFKKGATLASAFIILLLLVAGVPQTGLIPIGIWALINIAIVAAIYFTGGPDV